MFSLHARGSAIAAERLRFHFAISPETTGRNTSGDVTRCFARIREEHGEQVRDNIVVDGERMTSKVNAREFACGKLEVPTLRELLAACRLLCQL